MFDVSILCSQILYKNIRKNFIETNNNREFTSNNIQILEISPAVSLQYYFQFYYQYYFLLF